MPNTRVLVVEEKTGQAKGLCTELRGLGYSARSVALSKTEKVKISEAKQPDLIILDIKLEEHVGGIEAVKEINNHLDIPVIYLTAYCDEEILQRAGLANLFGYLLKPHRSEELQACIEVALHRHKQEKQLRERNQWLATVLQSMGSGLIATDAEGRVKLMNSVAEHLTGWERQAVIGLDVSAVFKITDGDTGKLAMNPVKRAIREVKAVESSDCMVLINRDGSQLPILESAAPILDNDGTCIGGVLIFHVQNPQEKNIAASVYQAALRNQKQGGEARRKLTLREMEVLKLIGEGKGNKEIARKLFISVRTVEFHRSRIMRKLNVENVADLIKSAITLGLTTPEPNDTDSSEEYLLSRMSVRE